MRHIKTVNIDDNSQPRQRVTKQSSKTRRILIGFVGWAVLLVGIVMIPYPGPGWVVVFLGLSLLATEFEWAQDAHDYVHNRYEVWQAMMSRQPWYIIAIFWCLTAITVVVTMWLLNGYGLINDWFHLGFNWVRSPLFHP